MIINTQFYTTYRSRSRVVYVLSLRRIYMVGDSPGCCKGIFEGQNVPISARVPKRSTIIIVAPKLSLYSSYLNCLRIYLAHAGGTAVLCTDYSTCAYASMIHQCLMESPLVKCTHPSNEITTHIVVIRTHIVSYGSYMQIMSWKIRGIFEFFLERKTPFEFSTK